MPLTRLSFIEFNFADVSKPLASAAKVVRCGYRIVLDSDGAFIVNRETGERMEVEMQDETFVFDIQFENGEQGTIILDSGAGAHVVSDDKMKEVPTMPRRLGVRMCAASGPEIVNHFRNVIKLRGNDFSKAEAERRIFSRRL